MRLPFEGDDARLKITLAEYDWDSLDDIHPLFAELIEDILIVEPSERLDINDICKKLNGAKKDIFQ